MSDPPQLQRERAYTTCAMIDMAALGRSARLIGEANPVLSAVLFKLLGLNCVLSSDVEKAFKTRKLDIARDTKSLDLYMHILWLAREGLSMVEDYVMPMVAGVQVYRYTRGIAKPSIVTDMAVLKVICQKLKADYLYLYCLFHNSPAVSRLTTAPGLRSTRNCSIDKGKQRATETDEGDSPTVDRSYTYTPGQSSTTSLQSTHPLEHGLQSPYITALHDFSLPTPDVLSKASFLLPLKNYIPDTLLAYLEVVTSVESLLCGSHPIRLSTKLSYAQFLFDCCAAGSVVDGRVDWRSSAESGEDSVPRGHDGKTEARRVCWRAINHAYETKEGVDDSMFEESARLVVLLGRMGGRRGDKPRSNTIGDEPHGSAGIASAATAAPGHRRSKSSNMTASVHPGSSWAAEESENNPVDYSAYGHMPYGGDAARSSPDLTSWKSDKPGRGARLGQMIYGAAPGLTSLEGPTQLAKPKKASRSPSRGQSSPKRKVLSPLSSAHANPGVSSSMYGNMI